MGQTVHAVQPLLERVVPKNAPSISSPPTLHLCPLQSGFHSHDQLRILSLMSSKACSPPHPWFPERKTPSAPSCAYSPSTVSVPVHLLPLECPPLISGLLSTSHPQLLMPQVPLPTPSLLSTLRALGGHFTYSQTCKSNLPLQGRPGPLLADCGRTQTHSARPSSSPSLLVLSASSSSRSPDAASPSTQDQESMSKYMESCQHYSPIFHSHI